MDGQTPTYQNTQPIQTPSPISPSDKSGKGFLFEVIFVVIFLLLFGVLNYFNILPLSKLFPSYLGFLPRREVPTGTSQQSQQSNNVVISPTDQAKQTLTSFLLTILNPSFLPKSNSEINLTQDKKIKDNFHALWITKEGIAGSNFYISSDSKKITSLYFQFEKIQTASPSVQLAKSEVNKIFSSNPKGEWGCKPWVANNTIFCEKFWTDSDETKRGLGFLIFSTPLTRGRLIFSACEYSQKSSLYSWKSCRAEFAKTGVQ